MKFNNNLDFCVLFFLMEVSIVVVLENYQIKFETDQKRDEYKSQENAGDIFCVPLVNNISSNLSELNIEMWGFGDGKEFETNQRSGPEFETNEKRIGRRMEETCCVEFM